MLGHHGSERRSDASAMPSPSGSLTSTSMESGRSGWRYLAGDWCPGHAARFARLAANRAIPAEARDARKHLDACPSWPNAYETFTRLHPSGA
jgi:hypothetical protein